MAVKKEPWTLEDLVDLEVAVNRSIAVEAELGREVRDGLRSGDFAKNELVKKRWAFKKWLSHQPDEGIGRKVSSTTRLLGLALLIFTFLAGIGVIRGLVSEFNYELDGEKITARGFNIWIFLAATLGIQWLFIIGGFLGFIIVRRWKGGLGWLRNGLMKLLEKFVTSVKPETWSTLLRSKAHQRGALTWRLARIAQLGGIGFNLGLLLGFFGMLWFTKVGFYWESSLPQFGEESLEKITKIISLPWGGAAPSGWTIQIMENNFNMKDAPEVADPAWGNPKPLRGRAEAQWRLLFFIALLVWGLFPRIIFWIFTIFKERKTLASFDFQDTEHRKLWREMSRVERVVEVKGPSDGVVLLDVGGLDLDVQELRPFLLQSLRVNPEKTYSVGVLDAAEEKEAWNAMKNAPCGVILLVEGWSLSPKQMTALINRLRREAGTETVLRILVMGDGIAAPAEDEFTAWQGFVDGLRDPRLECVAFKK